MTAARLEAARGEWEAFQIAVSAGEEQPLAAVSARAAPLAGPGPGIPVRLYRVGLVDLTVPSSIEGATGRWPDPLIPDVDSFVGEQRHAFPFAVPERESRAIWVEVFVPPGRPPGVYRGHVVVSIDRVHEIAVPVELTVRNFTLPRTSTLPVTFGFSSGALAFQHPDLNEAERADLARRYAVSALRHRVSLHGGSMTAPPFTVEGGRLRLDFADYDAEVGPFLDGTADRGGPAEGARFSAVDVRVPPAMTGTELDQYLASFVDHLRARGFLGTIFHYTADEPPAATFARVRARAQAIRHASAAVKRLVTTEPHPALADAVDLFCPLVNQVAERPHRGTWWYQSCMSHGCDIVGGSEFTGWPSLAIDAPPVAHRIFEWLTFSGGLTGELYYNTVEAYAKGHDPLRDPRVHGGNGDGTLFYPGRAREIGGRHDIPLESIRLHRIRDGLEDWEYLESFAARYGKEAAIGRARSIAPAPRHWEHDPARLLLTRHALADAIERRPPPR
jgi:hypothetical protein